MKGYIQLHGGADPFWMAIGLIGTIDVPLADEEPKEWKANAVINVQSDARYVKETVAQVMKLIEAAS